MSVKIIIECDDYDIQSVKAMDTQRCRVTAKKFKEPATLIVLPFDSKDHCIEKMGDEDYLIIINSNIMVKRNTMHVGRGLYYYSSPDYLGAEVIIVPENASIKVIINNEIMIEDTVNDEGVLYFDNPTDFDKCLVVDKDDILCGSDYELLCTNFRNNRIYKNSHSSFSFIRERELAGKDVVLIPTEDIRW